MKPNGWPTRHWQDDPGNLLLRLRQPDHGTVHHTPAVTGGRLQKLYQDPAHSFPARGTLARAMNDVVRRLGVSGAMLLEPALIFADEATSRLDLVTQERTMGCLMSELTEAGCALLLVTHDRELADAVCNHRLELGQTVGRQQSRAVPTG